jgi:hypothetical protein
VEDGTFWSAKASDYLRGYLWAAALAGYDMRAVAAGASGADPDIPERILIAAGARQWALTLAKLRSEAHKTTATVLMVTSRALSFPSRPGRRVRHPMLLVPVPRRRRHRARGGCL